MKKHREPNSWREYNVCFEEDDEVVIHLDLKRAEIRLIVNGERGPIAFKNIKKSKDIQYKLLVSLYSEGNCVEILHFSTRTPV